MTDRQLFSALYPVVAVDDPQATATAFQRLFGLERVFETGWYVHLKSVHDDRQIGFVRFDHDSVPGNYRIPVRGTFVTIDAADVAGIWRDLKGQLDVVVPLTDEAWGQRHFICRLPGDVLVDVVQLIAPEAATEQSDP